MDHVTFLEYIPGDARALAAAARASGSDAPVPSCSEWTMSKLVKHTGTIHRWVIGVIDQQGPISPAELDLGIPESEADYPEWLETGASALVSALAAQDPEGDLWAWGADQHVRFWSRRMAHETAVHRWDGETALGAPTPIERALAVDGIDERFENLPSSISRTPAGVEALVGDGESIHLHATDTDGEWLIRFTPDGLVVTREHSKGDVAVRGTASDLLLLTLGREPASPLEIFGDEAMLEAKAAILPF